MKDYQQRAAEWVADVFPGLGDNLQERALRFLEEALELVQALDISQDTAEQLVAYVFKKPPGVPFQELGGTIFTLSTLAAACKIDLQDAAERELERVHSPEVLSKIHQKHQEKYEAGVSLEPGIT